MNTFQVTQREEETALDVDVPLSRPTELRLTVSEPRVPPISPECFNAPYLLLMQRA